MNTQPFKENTIRISGKGTPVELMIEAGHVAEVIQGYRMKYGKKKWDAVFLGRGYNN